MEIVAVSIFGVVLGIAISFAWIKFRAGTSGRSARTAEQESGSEIATMVAPSRIVVTNGDKEVLSMTVLEAADPGKRLRDGVRLPQQAVSGALRSLVEPLMQVAPSVGTAAMAHSKNLYEVVINGTMLPAIDGNGLRAIASAGKGFDHGRLYEPKNLQNAANAAAIWQIASVVVAQKHLADISATLKRVESKVAGVQSFLEEARLAVIRSAMNYLTAAKSAVEKGEFLDRTRDELEHFDIELDRASMALVDQIQRESAGELDHDTVGCEGEYQSAVAKHQRLSRLIGELMLCNEVRLANWYLCSVYPDHSHILAPRLEQIAKGLEEAKALNECLVKSVEADCSLIDATFTSDKVINERRADVRVKSADGQLALSDGIRRCEAIVVKIDSVRADRKATSRLIVETEKGIPSAVYLCS